MNAFNRRTARRIAAVSIVLAAVASPLAWFVAQENAEQDSVALAMEETRRLLGHSGIIDLGGHFWVTPAPIFICLRIGIVQKR